MLVEAVAVGVCGTDREIIAADYGEAPPGADRLVIGHESLGRVLEDPTGTLAAGDLVAGIVRHPDPVPCPNCAAGEWDMCRNGQYTEHGIKALHGFARDRWRVEPEFAVRLDPTLGTSACCWSRPAWSPRPGSTSTGSSRRDPWQPRERAGHRRRPDRAAGRAARRASAASTCTCSTGPPTGPSRSWPRGWAPRTTAAPSHDLGFEPDLVLECTGAPPVVFGVMDKVGPCGVVCLTGVSSGGHKVPLDAGRAQPGAGAGEQRGLRLGQRQPAALDGRRRRAGQGRRRAGSARWSPGGCRSAGTRTRTTPARRRHQGGRGVRNLSDARRVRRRSPAAHRPRPPRRRPRR